MTKRRGGRPPTFTSVEEMQEKIDEYFDYCDNRTKDIFIPKLGDHVTMNDPEPYTMSGLAYFLGMSRRSLVDYAHKDKFSKIVKRARRRVEYDIERRMNDKNTFTPGLIFNAKNNFGWQDKSEVELTEKPKFVVDEK